MAAIVDAARSCPAFCANHDAENSVCLGATVELDFRTPGRVPGLTASATVALGYSPDEGTDISLYFPGLGAAYLAVTDAERLADALKDLVAAARNAGPTLIPAPRTAHDDTAGGAK